MEPFTLTDTEIACGVTVAGVQNVAADAHVSGGLIVFARNVPPAYAASACRMLLVPDATFSGFNVLGQPVYRIR